MTATVSPDLETLPTLSAAVAVGQAGRKPSRLKAFLPPFAVFCVIIGLWYLVTYVVLDPLRRYMFPAPHKVIEIAFFDTRNLKELLQALGVTAEVTFMGLGIAIVLGVGAGIVMSQAKWIEASVFPWAVILQTVPVLALTPMIQFWFGFAISSRVLVCVLIAFFPIVSNTVFGLQAADRSMHELFDLHKVSRATRLWKLQLPAALPAMFAGFRVSAGLAVIGAVVGDMYFKQGVPGIGTLLSVYTSRIEFERLFGAVLLSSLLGIAVFVLFGWLSTRVVGRWYQANRG